MHQHDLPKEDRDNTPADNSTRSAAGCPSGVDRRLFMKLAGAGAAALSATGRRAPAVAGPFEPGDTVNHFVPPDKKLNPEWVKKLFAKGQPTVYSGDDLRTIAMPVGGICTGQLYLSGDGRLTHWDVFNQHFFSGYGSTNYELDRRPESPLDQGFALRVKSGEKTIVRTLDRRGFPGVRFCGEYPIATVEYAEKDVPVSVTL